ncbi:MAG: hypothetical protein OYG31_03365, partial [Candidatus Kaiserbacteria bacterium]|nr:hypothetical protein [Candidatus Kaiserbacteria bacterium]
RVMADFPNEDDDVLISASLVEAAEAREQSPAKGDGKMVIGLDIARAGSDNTAWVLRKGNYARVLMVKNGLDLMQTVGLTMKFLQDFPSAVVHLDLVSLGSGVFDRLRETEYARRVFGVGFGEKAQDEKTYKNLRVEAYDQTRQWLKHACLEKSPYWKELCIPHKTFDSSGRLVLETKEQIKRRGFSSPDVADALCFTLTRKLSSGGLTRPTFIDERALDLFGV